MKKLFLAAGLLASTFSFAQSNEKGTIQIGLGWGLTLGGATIKATPDGGSEISGTGTGAKANYGIRAQYGLSDNMSAGIYIRPEAAVYVTTFADLSSFSEDVTYSGTGFGLEGKYYLANSDGFNFYAGPAIGFTTGSGSTSGNPSTSLSGINYSLGVGLNWYFVKDVFGLSFDLDYQGNSLSGTDTDKTKWSVSNSGLYWGLGWTAHFGGK